MTRIQLYECVGAAVVMRGMYGEACTLWLWVCTRLPPRKSKPRTLYRFYFARRLLYIFGIFSRTGGRRHTAQR